MLRAASSAPSVLRLSSEQEEALRELLGPAGDLPSPPSPDDRTGEADPPGVIPGTGRRADDREPAREPEAK